MDNKIEYSISNIKSFKTNFDKYNSSILENIKKIEKEYIDIQDILNTPNSNKIIPELYTILKKYDDIVTNNGMYFTNIINSAIDEYSGFITELTEMVGGNES